MQSQEGSKNKNKENKTEHNRNVTDYDPVTGEMLLHLK